MTQNKKFLFAALAVALIVMVLVAAFAPLNAENIQRPGAPRAQNMVPTPITTPSNLDALSLTSNLAVGGNLTVSGTTNGYYCTNGSQTITGSATAIPATLTAAGITTPVFVQHSIAASPGNTYWRDYHINAGGVITIGLYQNILSGTVTPQAATTAVAVDYVVCGK